MKTIRNRIAALGAVILLGSTTGAGAHMPQVLPSAFDTGQRD